MPSNADLRSSFSDARADSTFDTFCVRMSDLLGRALELMEKVYDIRRSRLTTSTYRDMNILSTAAI